MIALQFHHKAAEGRLIDRDRRMTVVASSAAALGLGIFTLVMVALLIGLGVWQLQRRTEKHALIAALTERLAASNPRDCRHRRNGAR